MRILGLSTLALAALALTATTAEAAAKPKAPAVRVKVPVAAPKAPVMAAKPVAAVARPVTPAPAAAAQMAAPAAAYYSTAATDIGTLIDTPATKAVLDRHMPGFSSNPQVSMARGMTLRAVQPMAGGMIRVEALDMIDADLAKLPKQ